MSVGPNLLVRRSPEEILTGRPTLGVGSSALIGIFLSGDNSDSANTGLDAGQVNLSYSNAATGGALVSVPLTGTTIDDGYIVGTTEPGTGFTLSAGTTDTTTWQLSLAAGAPGSAANDALRLEVDLDQVDTSSGATSNLDYDSGILTAIAGAATTTPPITTPTGTTTTIVEPTTTTIEPGSTITKTVIETVPLVAAKCTVPKLVGDSPKSTAAALKKANCTSVTQIEPAHRKSQKLVVKTANPKAGTRLPVGGTLTVTFKAVAVKKAT